MRVLLADAVADEISITFASLPGRFYALVTTVDLAAP